jgi:ribosomal protein S8
MVNATLAHGVAAPVLVPVSLIKGMTAPVLASELDEVPNNLQARVKAMQAFLRRYPTSILAPVFDNYGFLRTPKEMVNDVIIDHAEIKHDYSDQMASVIAGIVIVSDTTPEDYDARVMEVLN